MRSNAVHTESNTNNNVVLWKYMGEGNWEYFTCNDYYEWKPFHYFAYSLEIPQSTTK